MVHLIIMKKLILVVGLIALSLIGICQKSGAIEGIVFDSVNNKPVPYVGVQLLHSKLGTSTDTNGKFFINCILPGEREFQFALIGYGDPRIIKVNILSDSTVFVQINLFQCKFDEIGMPDCPMCNKTDCAIPIVYDEPTRRNINQSKKGKIWLGGIKKSPCHPHWYCTRDMIQY